MSALSGIVKLAGCFRDITVKARLPGGRASQNTRQLDNTFYAGRAPRCDSSLHLAVCGLHLGLQQMALPQTQSCRLQLLISFGDELLHGIQAGMAFVVRPASRRRLFIFNSAAFFCEIFDRDVFFVVQMQGINGNTLHGRLHTDEK